MIALLVLAAVAGAAVGLVIGIRYAGEPGHHRAGHDVQAHPIVFQSSRPVRPIHRSAA